jgi:hypothetical protein
MTFHPRSARIDAKRQSHERKPVANAIEIRIEEISQLFHSLDPFPFREKDLDKEAEELGERATCRSAAQDRRASA